VGGDAAAGELGLHLS